MVSVSFLTLLQDLENLTNRILNDGGKLRDQLNYIKNQIEKQVESHDHQKSQKYLDNQTGYTYPQCY